tara:strand:- start:98 stop:208 length:111 start_codon:yes stop_codon:yes gene_type:complete
MAKIILTRELIPSAIFIAFNRSKKQKEVNMIEKVSK